PRDRVEHAVAWCRSGPPSAEVTRLDLSWEPPSGDEHGFVIGF
ncbi:MAG: acylphosphatase, partial [Planctomycetes bacterium]|nr:acylphosphatase [Planctomycetota bacterium]